MKEAVEKLPVGGSVILREVFLEVPLADVDWVLVKLLHGCKSPLQRFRT
jgi:hypothetical protein